MLDGKPLVNMKSKKELDLTKFLKNKGYKFSLHAKAINNRNGFREVEMRFPNAQHYPPLNIILTATEAKTFVLN